MVTESAAAVLIVSVGQQLGRAGVRYVNGIASLAAAGTVSLVNGVWLN